ncbi:hypothetical protein FKM82_027626 [Ascaphus truei]
MSRALCSDVVLTLYPLSHVPDIRALCSDVLAQGFDTLILSDIPGESVSVDIHSWREMAAGERLLANLTAFLALERQLERVSEEQTERLTPGERALHVGLRDMLGQVSALRGQLEQLGATLGLREGWKLEIGEGEEESVFERKVRGYRVLRELSGWAVRGVRDLRKIKRERM